MSSVGPSPSAVSRVGSGGAGSISAAPWSSANCIVSLKLRDVSRLPPGGLAAIDQTGIVRFLPSGPATSR
jgi:hypothetical protein